MLEKYPGVLVFTLPKTNSSPLKSYLPKRKRSSSNHPFSGAMLVSGRVATHHSPDQEPEFFPKASGTIFSADIRKSAFCKMFEAAEVE